MKQEKLIVIVGGGITGLSAAYYLQKEIRENNLNYQVKLIEASSRVGGKIRTLKKDGFIIERGADSFLGRKKSGQQLAEQLGIADQLVRNETGQSYILANHKLHPMPAGSFMGIPTKILPFLRSTNISMKGKLRTGLDFVLPKGNAAKEETLGGFFRRRFGNELVDQMLEPLLSGVYSGDIDQMGLLATFPNFYELEQTYGSLIRGLQKTMPSRSRSTGKRSGQFFSFNRGFDSLIDALEKQLDENTMMLNSTVKRIKKKADHYNVLLHTGNMLKADAIILASPHNTIPSMFSNNKTFQKLIDIPTTSVANVALAFDKSAIQKTINGTGFVVSRKSDYRITACTWTNEKWPFSTPDGFVLLRAYVGKPTDQVIVDLSDQEITNIVLNDLKRIMTITKQPIFSVVTRYKNKMPQYTVGHIDRIKDIRKKTSKQFPGVCLAGSSYAGVGVPDCIDQGKKAVKDIINYLKS